MHVSLRTKVVLLSVGSLLAAAAVLMPLVVVLTQQSIEELEHQDAHSDIQLFASALSTSGNDVASIARTWGGWDEAHSSLTDPVLTNDFASAYMTRGALEPLGVEFMALVPFDAHIEGRYHLDTMGEHPLALTGQLHARLIELGLLENHDPLRATKMIARIEDAPMLLVAQPITNNDFTATATGVLVVGRRLDAKEVNRIAGSQGLEVEVATNRQSPGETEPHRFDFGVIRHADSVNSDSIRVTMLITDPLGADVIELVMDRPRVVYALGIRTMLLATAALAAVGLALALTSFAAMNRVVLARVARMAKQMESIASTSDPSTRLDVDGHDELSLLGTSANSMLQSLEDARTQLERANIGNLTYALELERSMEALREADAAKDRFLVGMSHELRTPLNAIIGFSGLLKQGLAGSLNSEQDVQVGMINTAGRHLLQLINDLLDLAKIRAGRIDVSNAMFSLTELLVECARLSEPLIDTTKVLLVLNPPSEDIDILSDRARVMQVLLNLTGNAAKFTPEGSITISASLTDDSVLISVQDTGVGIPEGDLARIMEEFVQLETPTDSVRKGTGLGLALSTQLAHLLGGTLTATSEVGVGSSFVLELPLEPVNTHEADSQDAHV